MSIEDNDVPYEDHVIPSGGVGGASGLSGLFDMVAGISKDVVGLAKAITSDVVQLGQEVVAMTKDDAPMDQDRVDRLAWAEEQRQQFLEHKRMMTHDRDFSR